MRYLHTHRFVACTNLALIVVEYIVSPHDEEPVGNACILHEEKRAHKIYEWTCRKTYFGTVPQEICLPHFLEIE